MVYVRDLTENTQESFLLVFACHEGLVEETPAQLTVPDLS
jgi:hypothetical protein